MTKPNWEKRIFTPRQGGKISMMLIEFFTWCKQGKRAILRLPEGDVYSPEALKSFLKQEKKELLEEVKEWLNDTNRPASGDELEMFLEEKIDQQLKDLDE